MVNIQTSLQLIVIILMLICNRVSLAFSPPFRIRQSVFRRSARISSSILSDLDNFGLSCENTIEKYLVKDRDNASQYQPRQVRNAHFTGSGTSSEVKCEPVPLPYLVAASTSCAISIGLNPLELTKPRFVQAFSGNQLLEGLNKPYCTVYGCHCHGQWFGQLGDGRAMGIGEVMVQRDNTVSPTQTVRTVIGEEFDIHEERFELQLKGCGRSPYSRGFDGRAVLRSSVREFLVSEAMFHLGVPTTRALSVIGTGQEIRRPWYAITSQGVAPGAPGYYTAKLEGQKFQPDVMLREPGAVLCRVAKSFLRFSHLELFARRMEMEELKTMADYVCRREYPHLLAIGQSVDESKQKDGGQGQKDSPVRYIQMYREISQRCAKLVAEWLRVGYVQGNMNSDNTLLGGRTIDYGPYGWLERYDPMYQPFTSDTDGKFAFTRQPSAMSVNIVVLGEVIEQLVRHCCADPSSREANDFAKEVQKIGLQEFQDYFWSEYGEIRRRKLGFRAVHDEDSVIWAELEKLLFQSKCDYTIFFRELAKAAECSSPEDALSAIEISFYGFTESGSPSSTNIDSDSWIAWFKKYLYRIQNDARDPHERRAEQNKANPKYVLRNWMSMLAYEKAENGDYSIINELMLLLEQPYDEHTHELEARWYLKTPDWAKGMPGTEFLS